MTYMEDDTRKNIISVRTETFTVSDVGLSGYLLALQSGLDVTVTGDGEAINAWQQLEEKNINGTK